MSSRNESLKLKGKSLSPGLAQGLTFVHRDVLDRLDEYYDIDADQVSAEKRRLEKAFDRIQRDLSLLTSQVEREMDAQIAGIFEAHQMMLQDPTLKNDVMHEIEEELVSAGAAVKTVFRRWERRFRSLEAEISRQKGDDLRDLSRRLINALAGIHGHSLEKFPEGSVLIVARLLPSDTVFLSRRSAAAALLEKGGLGSHAALFAREIGLPCIAQLPGLLDTIPSGAPVLVDADAAVVTVHPDATDKTEFRLKVERRRNSEKSAQSNAGYPAVTRDGTRIRVLANIGCLDDAREALAKGAEGVGLYRTEQVYIGRQAPPDTNQLLEEMRNTLAPLQEKPVYIRLLDVGADKPLPFMDSSRENNPSLGRRGVRLLRKYPDLLQTQLSALVQLSADFDVHILVPMVALAEDISAVRDALAQCCDQMSVAQVPELGAMIETPAAALSAKKLGPHADFLSFGTNDLTQYAFAADRENAAVDNYFNDTDDVIFRFLELTRQDVPGLPLSVCGELAGRPDFTERLLQCGITTLSVAPPLIPKVKEAIRNSSVVAH